VPLPPALYLIASPIGNRQDITARAIDCIQSVDRLYAEDTRHSRRLLELLQIERPLLPCHEHNEIAMGEEIVRHLQEGKSCGLLSDAGTPGISDPGFRVVRACRREGLPVVPLPGPSAMIAALSVSGLPTDRFHFFGFLPPKKAARQKNFIEYKEAPDTLIYYESTHRIEKFLEDAESVFGAGRTICLARELTKHYETILTGTIEEVRRQFAGGSSKGEFVILIAKEGYVL
jgi:16S rRNA (cytidine1402-2'-O)-methyltransferase